MNLSNKRTAMVILIGLLWIVIAVLGWKNQFMPGLYLSVVLMLLHMMLGCASKGRLDARFLLYPLGIWAVLWAVSFGLSKYYSDVFKGGMPDFTILGFHPSFAFTVLTYWLGGVATLSLGFILLKDTWLSAKDWEDFKKTIAELKKEEGAK